MKALIILGLFSWLTVSTCKAQAPSITIDASGHSELTFVFDAAGTKDELFLKAKQWIFHTYNSGKAVEQVEDKETGHFFVKGKTNDIIREKGGMNDGSFTYDLTIDVKDNKARIAINQIYYKAGITSNSMYVPSGGNLADSYPINWPTIRKKSFASEWLVMQERTKADLVALSQSLQSALNKPKSDF